VEKWPHLKAIVVRQICVLWKGGDSPKLPYDGISSIFERIGDFDLKISAIIVVCGGFLILWRHGGKRQEAKRQRANEALRGYVQSRDEGRGRGRRRKVPGERNPTTDFLSMADISFIGAVKDEWQLYRFLFSFRSIFTLRTSFYNLAIFRKITLWVHPSDLVHPQSCTTRRIIPNLPRTGPYHAP
jgi:hypothetical protein